MGIFWTTASRACNKEPPAVSWNPVPGASIPHTADGGVSACVMATRNTCTGGQACYHLEEYVHGSVITLLTAPEPPVKSFDPTSEQPCEILPGLTSCLCVDRLTPRTGGDVVKAYFPAGTGLRPGSDRHHQSE